MEAAEADTITTMEAAAVDTTMEAAAADTTMEAVAVDTTMEAEVDSAVDIIEK